MTAAWPQTDRRLERAYRRLMLAYPARYRRHHGTEIVTTLLEMAGPEQRRPDRADAWHLLASGARQRLRLPAGRPLALAFAVLVMLIGGALGAAAGSALAAQALADPSNPTAMTRLASGYPAEIVDSDGGSPWSESQTYGIVRVAGTWDIEQSRQRLAAAGWQVGPVLPLSGSTVRYDPDTGAAIDVPMHNGEVRAHKDGVAVLVQAYLDDDRGSVNVDSWAEPTPILLPLVIAGIAVGLLVGWLLAAAGSYRIIRSGRPIPAALLAATAVAALVLPAVALYGNVMRAFQYADSVDPVFTVHRAFLPGPYYPFGPPWQVLALTIAGIVLAFVAALIARPGERAQPEQSPAS